MSILVVDVLLGAAVFIACVASLGLLTMRNAFQRLQFCSVVVVLCPIAIAISVWIDGSDAQARIKVILVTAILFLMNPVLATATAKATRIHEVGHWEPHSDEGIPIEGREGLAGSHRRGSTHQA